MAKGASRSIALGYVAEPEACNSSDVVIATRSKNNDLHTITSNRWVLQDITGSTPEIGYLREATDAKTGRVYMYSPSETKSKGCNLFVFNAATVKVLDLSNRLQYRSRRQFTNDRADSSLRKKKFPPIEFPSIAFKSSGNLLVMFGGYIDSGDELSDCEASSRLILIDVSDFSRLQWWRQKVEGTAQARVDATIAVIGDRIYLFGGVDKVHGPNEPPGVLLRSFSILEHDRETRRWKWVVSDAPYPTNDVPSDISFGHATPVYDGKSILLTPLKTAPSFESTFTSKNIFYFCTETYAFRKAKLVTDEANLPQNLWSYYTASFIPPPNNCTLGNDAKYTCASPQKRRLLFQPASSPESVLVCGWSPLYEGGEPVPELWRLFLFPNDRIACLNIQVSDDLRKLPADFHYFTMIDHAIYLLGSEHEEGQNHGNVDASQRLLDACLEISVEASELDLDDST